MDGLGLGMAPQAGAQAGMTNPGSPVPGPGIGQPNAGITIPMHAPKHGTGRRKTKGHHSHSVGSARHGRAGRRRN